MYKKYLFEGDTKEDVLNVIADRVNQGWKAIFEDNGVVLVQYYSDGEIIQTGSIVNDGLFRQITKDKPDWLTAEEWWLYLDNYKLYD